MQATKNIWYIHQYISKHLINDKNFFIREF